ncbi:MAG: 23S rRNA (adenine(2503)-C(2))-methyltransferase RlmN [candidate division KSB1 bacterium]|nr:23S rRNA (adenine(2503)-C(2))-methyltransferase RlmN [candidate division KSB1 bacterium]MDZ7304631.1 23S rRNA (adenine(2503)-C(2))-methyltransferase RlmN [candidate division KSB1 bacterium]MDZ7313763.1 23S rRNA (adenine(2503)-C(2))-methyltransferase RlmN [candidate division KSB1 bacterium]
MPKKNLIGLNRDELAAFMVAQGEQPFRARQLFRWIYGKAVSSFDEITDFAKPLRQRLHEAAALGEMTLVTRQISHRRDAEKYLFRLSDGLHIESVLMHEEPRSGLERHTLCISSQVGCPVDCKFCATGMMGLLRNLTTAEIVEQVLVVKRTSGSTITNLVVMGMGEPMLNYDALIKACYLLSDDEGPNLAQRRIVISTSGLVPKIERFTREGHKFRLAISLNATTDEVRSRLMPINRKYPIATLLQAAKEYTLQAKQRVTFEYLLLAEINDTLEDAERLKNLTRSIPCKINLIPYNPVHGVEQASREKGWENGRAGNSPSHPLSLPPSLPFGSVPPFRRPSFERIEAFLACMREGPNAVTLRWSKGDDIDAACGQLWTKVEKQRRITRMRRSKI